MLYLHLQKREHTTLIWVRWLPLPATSVLSGLCSWNQLKFLMNRHVKLYYFQYSVETNVIYLQLESFREMMSMKKGGCSQPSREHKILNNYRPPLSVEERVVSLGYLWTAGVYQLAKFSSLFLVILKSERKIWDLFRIHGSYYIQTFLSGLGQEPFIINVELFFKRHIYADIFILCIPCIPSKIMPEKNHLQVLTMPTFYYKALFIVMNFWIINYYAIGYQGFVAGIYHFIFSINISKLLTCSFYAWWNTWQNEQNNRS